MAALSGVILFMQPDSSLNLLMRSLISLLAITLPVSLRFYNLLFNRRGHDGSPGSTIPDK